MKRVRIAVGVIAAILVLAACAGDSAEDTTTTGAAVTTTVASETTTTAGDDGGSGATANVSIQNFDFSAPESVEAGTTLVIANNDGVAHTFTDSDEAFDSGSISGGASAEVTLEEPGEYSYFCRFHPQMTGTITVTG